MTPLEAMRHLNTTLTADGLDCLVCGGLLYTDRPNGGHLKPECPVLAVPQIIAVLEAAEEVVPSKQGGS